MLGTRSQASNNENINILLVEADINDAVRDKSEILDNSFSNVSVRLMCDTTAALQYINGGHRAAGQENPNLLVLDEKLDEQEAMQIARKAKENPNTKILMLCQLPAKTRSKSLIDGYLNKPLNSEELITALEGA